MTTYPSASFLERMTDVLVRHLDVDRQEAEREELQSTLRPDEDSTPESHRVWLEAILRGVLVEAALAYADHGEFPPGADFAACKAIVDRHVEPIEHLIAELRGVDLPTLRRLDKWAD